MDLPCLSNNIIINDGSGNNYIITRVLGAGGFGITYLAWMEKTSNGVVSRRRIALKEHFVKTMCERKADGKTVNVFSNLEDTYKRSLKDFIGEATRLKKIARHPNIVRVNDVFQLNGTAYYAMEYVEGYTLQKLVSQQGAMNEFQMRSIMDQIIDAVAMLHKAKITHLDIKPANIMIDAATQRPVLIDFGLSKHYHDDGTPTSTINTHGFSDGYAPVEQYAGVSTFSPTCDVYSLAATMFYCLTGHRLPRAGEIQPGDIERLLPANLSIGLRNALTNALAYAASDRTPDATALLRSLDNTQIVTVQTIDDPTTQTRLANIHRTVSPKNSSKKHRNIFLLFIIFAITFVIATWYFISPEINKVSDTGTKSINNSEKFNTGQDSLPIDSQIITIKPTDSVSSIEQTSHPKPKPIVHKEKKKTEAPLGATQNGKKNKKSEPKPIINSKTNSPATNENTSIPETESKELHQSLTIEPPR